MTVYDIGVLKHKDVNMKKLFQKWNPLNFGFERDSSRGKQNVLWGITENEFIYFRLKLS